MRPWYAFCWRMSGAIGERLFNGRLEGQDNIPAGNFLAVSNHQSFLDPLLVGWALDREAYYLARKSLWESWILGAWMTSVNTLPIDQDRPDMSGLKRIIKLLNEGESVLIFPEGARTLDGQLQPGQPGAGLVAAKTHTLILPMRIFGAYEALPRGSSKLRFLPVRIVIGKPFELPDEMRMSKDKHVYSEISQLMMRKIAELT